MWELITDASTLPIQPGNTLWDHLNNLGGGLPFPVPVEMIGVENISLINAESTQITTQTVADGIDQQVITEQVDHQAIDDQIELTTGNKCP